MGQNFKWVYDKKIDCHHEQNNTKEKFLLITKLSHIK